MCECGNLILFFSPEDAQQHLQTKSCQKRDIIVIQAASKENLVPNTLSQLYLIVCRRQKRN